MASLDQWFAARDDIRRMYDAELGRDLVGDPDALTNWLYHWREGRHDLDWIRDRIRESPEWHGRHRPGGSEPDSPAPPPPAIPPGSPVGGGGLLESIASRAVRPRLSAAEIRRFLPDRGPFIFPAPYGTRAARITNASDGMVRPIGMSYWPNCNYATGRDELTVFVSVEDTLVLFSVDKATLAVRRLDALPFHTTGEGCSWSLVDPDLLYVPQETRLLRYHVRTHQIEVAVDAPSAITQCHSSLDGEVHSFTLAGAAAVWRNGKVSRFSPNGSYDECQIDKSGQWLCIKEGDRANRIVDLASGREWTITQAQKSVGHSDMGWGYLIGEDNQTDPGGVFRRWDFTANGPQDGGVQYATDWTSMTRYVSHCNAVQGRPEGQRVLYSGAVNADVPRSNELVLGRLDGSGEALVVCPNLTDLGAAGGGDEYWRKTRANLDPTGRYACFSGNMGTDRMDVFVVALPS